MYVNISIGLIIMLGIAECVCDKYVEFIREKFMEW